MAASAQWRKKRTRNIWIMVLLGLGVVLCISMVLYDRGAKLAGSERYVELAEQVHVPAVAGETEAAAPVDFAALRAVNSDAVAWLYGAGTKIDYPVVQGADNEFYLHHSIDRTYSVPGTLFLDQYNAPDFTDGNSIIYGHQMSDESMFGSLLNYYEQSYYNQHPTMELYTPEGEFLVEVFAGYLTTAEDYAMIYTTGFSSTADFVAYADKVRARSTFTSSVELTTGDRILTLSTCTPQGNEERYVVLGRITPLGNG